MTLTVKHQCDSCGGQLTIDEDKQLYKCPFCGMTFDYEYFKEEDVHKKIKDALRTKEYNAAKDACEFILAKDPHDLEALKGLFLSSAHIGNFSQTFNFETLQGISYNTSVMERIMDSANPEDKDFFRKCEEVLQSGEELKKINDEKTALEKELKQHQHYVDDAAALRTGGLTLPICIIMMGIYFLLLVLTGMLKQNLIFIILGVIFIALIILGVILLIKNFTDKAVNQNLADARNRAADITAELEKKKEEFNRLMSQTKMKMHELNKANLKAQIRDKADGKALA